MLHHYQRGFTAENYHWSNENQDWATSHLNCGMDWMKLVYRLDWIFGGFFQRKREMKLHAIHSFPGLFGFIDLRLWHEFCAAEGSMNLYDRFVENAWVTGIKRQWLNWFLWEPKPGGCRCYRWHLFRRRSERGDNHDARLCCLAKDVYIMTISGENRRRLSWCLFLS
jgi:hypothetical protein